MRIKRNETKKFENNWNENKENFYIQLEFPDDQN